jgi:iron complex outermembrane receptor protein
VANFTNTISSTRCASSTILCLSGKTLPDSPEWVISGGVTWEPTDWIVANISAKYQSDRYSNFVNTEEIPDYTTLAAYVDFGTGDGDGSAGPVQGARKHRQPASTKTSWPSSVRRSLRRASFRPLNPRTVSVSVSADF